MCVCVLKFTVHCGLSYTWKGVLIRLTSVSKIWTLSCWCRRMKERKVCSSAGSVTLLRKRSRYAVVVITSSRVSFIETGNSMWSEFRATERIIPEKDSAQKTAKWASYIWFFFFMKLIQFLGQRKQLPDLYWWIIFWRPQVFLLQMNSQGVYLCLADQNVCPLKVGGSFHWAAKSEHVWQEQKEALLLFLLFLPLCCLCSADAHKQSSLRVNVKKWVL